MRKLDWTLLVILVMGAVVIWRDVSKDSPRRSVVRGEGGGDEQFMRGERSVFAEAMGKFEHWLMTDHEMRQLEKEGPPVQPGEIRSEGSGESQIQVLVDGDREVMRARKIGIRSKSLDGTYAVETWNGPHQPPDKAEMVKVDGVWKLDSSPREVWLVPTSGPSRCVSPKGVDAVIPIISPDARLMAYTERRFDGKDWGAESLVCLDLVSGKVRRLLEAGTRESYEVNGFDWKGKRGELRVYECWGETGSHVRIRKFRIPR
jgi:hypothetical protein